MLAIILTPEQHEYLTYVFQEYCKAGVPPEELGFAANALKALSSPQKFELPPPTQVIEGPVSVEVKGNMTMPLSAFLDKSDSDPDDI